MIFLKNSIKQRVKEISMTDYRPEAVEDLDHGVRREWYADRQIVAFRLPNYQDATVNAWGESLIETLSQHDPTKPLYLVVVLEGKFKFEPTRLRDWAGKIIEQCKRLPNIHIGLVIDQPLFAQLAGAFVHALFLKSSFKIDTRVTTKFSDIMDWQMKNVTLYSRTALRS
jgi:hypothetical protein